MLFSEYYNIKEAQKEEWFDPVMGSDTPLFIDPMLVYQNEISCFKNSKNRIQDFFQEAFEKVALAKGRNGPERTLALQMLKFKEPKEVPLGYAQFGAQGSGLGPGFARQILDAITDLLNLGLEEFSNYISTFEMLVEGIGPDRISDMITNIIKEDLVDYTKKICKEKNIKMEKVLVENLGFNNGMWTRRKVELPLTPEGKPILLVPKDFLTARPNIEIDDFEFYISRIENEELRTQATRLFTSDLNRKKIIDALRKDPEVAKTVLRNYVSTRETEKLVGYDFSNDPSLIYWIKEKISKLVTDLPEINVTTFSKESIKDFVEKVITQFKQCIESNEGYFLLFNDNGTPKNEDASQILFWNIALIRCKEKDIDLSPENKTGRGFVDFKFSKGYSNRIHVEVKLARSTHLYSGLEKQVPLYLETDEVDTGYYLVIKQIGGDHARVAELQDRYQKMEDPKRSKIVIKVIDGIPETKISASKI